MPYERSPGKGRSLSAAADSSGIAPGKRALTDGLVRRQTGIPVVDQGFGCETDPTGQDCFLTSEQRSRLLISLGGVVASSFDNFHAAIQNTQLAKKLKRDNWGFWAEFAFYSVTGPMIAKLAKAFERFRDAAIASRDTTRFLALHGLNVGTRADQVKAQFARLSTDDFTALIQNASRGVRTELKHAPPDASADSFLKIVQGGLKEISDSLVLDAPATLNDAQFVALVMAYRDPVAHSVVAYEEALSDLLTRYETQKLDEVGAIAADGAVTRAVTLTAHGHRKTALIKAGGATLPAQTGSMVESVEPIGPNGKTTLVSIVDDDLGTYLMSTETIDITNGHNFEMPESDPIMRNTKLELDRWLAQAKADPHPNVEPISADQQAQDAGVDVVAGIAKAAGSMKGIW